MKRRILLAVFFCTWVTICVNAQSFKLVKDLYSKKDSLLYDYDAGMTYFNGKLYFTSYYGDIVVSDGTAEGTEIISNLGMPHMTALDFNKNRFLPMGGKLYYKNKKNWLCVTDGTSSGTKVIADIIPSDTTGLRGVMTFLGASSDKVFFVGNDGVTGNELWVSDGTEQGTKLVRNIAVNPDSRMFFPNKSAHHIGTVIDNKLYFFANDGVNGWEPWVSDGTSDGTFMLVNSNPNGDVSFGMSTSFGGYAASEMKFFKFKNAVYFVGFNGIYKTDGTVQGTVLVLNGSNYNSAAVTSMCVFDNYLYYDKMTGNLRTLMRTDGTIEGTTTVTSIPGAMSRGFQEFNGELYFRCKPNGSSGSKEEYIAKLKGSVIDSLTRNTTGYYSYHVNILQPIGNDFLYLGNYSNHGIYRYNNGANSLANTNFTSVYDNFLTTPIGVFAIGVNSTYGYELWKWEDVTTNIEKVVSKNVFKVYPNPTDHVIHVDVMGQSSMVIYNTMGVKVYAQLLDAGVNKVDVSALSNGLYYISVDKGATVLFVKE